MGCSRVPGDTSHPQNLSSACRLQDQAHSLHPQFTVCRILAAKNWNNSGCKCKNSRCKLAFASRAVSSASKFDTSRVHGPQNLGSVRTASSADENASTMVASQKDASFIASAYVGASASTPRSAENLSAKTGKKNNCNYKSSGCKGKHTCLQHQVARFQEQNNLIHGGSMVCRLLARSELQDQRLKVQAQRMQAQAQWLKLQEQWRSLDCKQISST